eukprot:scaffold10775_cov24-Tisochrysis_lutea.AAC.2
MCTRGGPLIKATSAAGVWSAPAPWHCIVCWWLWWWCGSTYVAHEAHSNKEPLCLLALCSRAPGSELASAGFPPLLSLLGLCSVSLLPSCCCFLQLPCNVCTPATPLLMLFSCRLLQLTPAAHCPCHPRVRRSVDSAGSRRSSLDVAHQSEGTAASADRRKSLGDSHAHSSHMPQTPAGNHGQSQVRTM